MDQSCRICYTNTGSTNIFLSDNSGDKLSQKIMYCCNNIQIAEDDGLPSNICVECEQELRLAYQFVLKCEKTDKSLRSQKNIRKHLKSQTANKSLPKFEVKTEEYDSENDTHCNMVLYDEEDDIKVEISDSKNCIIQKFRKVKKRHKYKECGPCMCSICGRKFLNPSTLFAHMRSHSNEKPYQCLACEKKYKDPGSLKRHTDRNHLEKRERKFVCETCGKGFYSKTDVVTHMRTHTGETPFACTECPSSFTQLSSLIRHKTKHTGEKSHTCMTCSKKFSTKDQLNAHSLVHTETRKQFSCTVCNVLFKYKYNLRKHMKMHTEPSRFVCNYCGRIFNLKGNLKSHIDRVHSEKSGYCELCAKIVSNIEVHMWRHTGQRPLKCEHCTSSFYELKALAHHMNFRHKHTDKFKCTVEGCYKAFPSQPMLDFHIAKLHESNIKFPCDRCSRGFYRKNDLARHKIGTHKEKLQ